MNEEFLIGEKLVSVYQVTPAAGQWPPLVILTEKSWYQISENGVERVCTGSGELVEVPLGYCVGAAVKEVRGEDADICILLDSGWMVHYFLNFDPSTNAVWPHLAFDSPGEVLAWKSEFNEMTRFL